MNWWWEDKIKVGLEETGWQDMGWIVLGGLCQSYISSELFYFWSVAGQLIVFAGAPRPTRGSKLRRHVIQE
jgi:hypothetical protein